MARSGVWDCAGGYLELSGF